MCCIICLYNFNLNCWGILHFIIPNRLVFFLIFLLFISPPLSNFLPQQPQIRHSVPTESVYFISTWIWRNLWNKFLKWLLSVRKSIYGIGLVRFGWNCISNLCRCWHLCTIHDTLKTIFKLINLSKNSVIINFSQNKRTEWTKKTFCSLIDWRKRYSWCTASCWRIFNRMGKSEHIEYKLL